MKFSNNTDFYYFPFGYLLSSNAISQESRVVNVTRLFCAKPLSGRPQTLLLNPKVPVSYLTFLARGASQQEDELPLSAYYVNRLFLSFPCITCMLYWVKQIYCIIQVLGMLFTHLRRYINNRMHWYTYRLNIPIVFDAT